MGSWMAIREREDVFVDTGAWIALALKGDPYHSRAIELWDAIRCEGARLHTSIPIVLETFTFLERNTDRSVALSWKDNLDKLRGLELLECTRQDFERAWPYFLRPNLHKLSAVDATSFAIMTRKKIRVAFAFDHHFAAVGFRLVG